MKYLIIGHRPGGGSPSELGNSTDMQAAIAKAKEFAGYLKAYAKITVEADGPGGSRKTWFSAGCSFAQGVLEPKPQPARPTTRPHENPYTRDLLPPALREQPKMSETNGAANKPEPAKPGPPADLSNPTVRHPMPDEQIRTSRLDAIKAANDRLAASKQKSRSAEKPAAGAAAAAKPWAELKKGERARLIEGLVKEMPDAFSPEVIAAAKGRGWQIEAYQVLAARKRLAMAPLRRGGEPSKAAATISGGDLDQLISFAQAVKPFGGIAGARRLCDQAARFMEAIA